LVAFLHRPRGRRAERQHGKWNRPEDLLTPQSGCSWAPGEDRRRDQKHAPARAPRKMAATQPPQAPSASPKSRTSSRGSLASCLAELMRPRPDVRCFVSSGSPEPQREHPSPQSETRLSTVAYTRTSCTSQPDPAQQTCPLVEEDPWTMCPRDPDPPGPSAASSEPLMFFRGPLPPKLKGVCCAGC